MNFKKSDVVGFSHRVVYAGFISAIVLIFTFLPLPEGVTYPGDNTILVVRWLDLPIAIAARLLPCGHSAIDLWFRYWCLEPIDDLRRFFYNHMRVGIPTYVLLFYLPSIYRAGRNW